MIEHIAGAVLAGGHGKRMGNPHKGLAKHSENKNIIDHITMEMYNQGIDLITISANEKELYAPFGRAVIQDIHPGRGPLSGVEATLSFMQKRHPHVKTVLFLPSDMPGVCEELIHGLLDAAQKSPARVVYATEPPQHRIHPLCCVVRVDALEIIASELRENKNKVRPVWEKLGCQEVSFDNASLFYNINTKEDLTDWHNNIRAKM